MIIMSIAMYGFRSFNYDGQTYSVSWHEHATLAYIAIFLTAIGTL